MLRLWCLLVFGGGVVPEAAKMTLLINSNDRRLFPLSFLPLA